MRKTSSMFVVAALALALGCGKKDDGKQGEAAPKGEPKAVAKDSPAGDPAAKPGTPPATAKPEDKPAPPPESFKGKARVINLLVDRDGKGHTIDVWAKRSFQYGPARLAQNVAPGTASEWFGVPEGQSVTFVAAGSDSDAESLGGLSAPRDGETATVTLTLDESGKPRSGQTSFVPTKPAAGKGLVVLEAGAFQGHAEAFKATLGGWGYAFKVGDGKGCREGRQTGLNLGGTSYVDYEVDPGKVTFALHKGDDYDCKQPAVYTIELDVAADAGQMVHVYTPDAKGFAHLVLPIEL